MRTAVRVLLVVFGTMLWVDRQAEGAAAPFQYSDPTVSFEYPAGWSVKRRGGFAEQTYKHCVIDIVFGHAWSARPDKTRGWANMSLEFFEVENAKSWNQSAYGVPVRNLKEYMDAIDCKIPYGSKGTDGGRTAFPGCGHYEWRMAAAKTLGHLYRYDAQTVPSFSSNAEFTKAFRSNMLVFSSGNGKWIANLQYAAPESEYRKFWPAFQRMAQTLRLTPDRALRCGPARTEEPPRSAASAGSSADDESGASRVDDSKPAPVLR